MHLMDGFRNGVKEMTSFTGSQFVDKLPSLLLSYKPEDVYNADKSGLFFVHY